MRDLRDDSCDEPLQGDVEPLNTCEHEKGRVRELLFSGLRSSAAGEQAAG